MASLVKQLRVEPILFLYNIADFLHNIGTGALISQKICYPEGPPGIEVVCTADEKLKESALVNVYKSNIRGFLPGLVVLLAGGWRDQTGLIKPLLILCHLGEMVAVLLEVLASFSWHSPVWISSVLDSIFGGVTGGRALMSMATMIYITEHTKPEERSTRMGIMHVFMMISMGLALASSGFVLSYFDYTRFFVFIFIVYSISLTLTLVLIKDGKKKETKNSGGVLSSLKKFEVMLEPKPNGVAIWLFIIANCITMVTFMCEMGVGHVFMQKKFQLTPKQGGLYASYKMLLNMIASAAAVPLLKKTLQLNDFGIIIISTIISTISSLGMAFSTSIPALYMFDSLGVFRITTLTTSQGIMTMCLKKSEAGVYSSFTSFVQGVLPIAVSPIYAYVFTHTVETMPGAFYLISAASAIITAIFVRIGSHYYVEVPDEDKEESDKKKS